MYVCVYVVSMYVCVCGGEEGGREVRGGVGNKSLILTTDYKRIYIYICIYTYYTYTATYKQTTYTSIHTTTTIAIDNHYYHCY